MGFHVACGQDSFLSLIPNLRETASPNAWDVAGDWAVASKDSLHQPMCVQVPATCMMMIMMPS